MQISILQGSASGTAVYVETQTPNTNINGLVSLEIGSGTFVSGAFNTIDWSDGPYFIKTETDPTGGTNYTITGTSQLMSVPYAIHANTADSIVGGDKDTQLDSAGVAALGYVAGAHTIDTDTQLDSTGVAALGYVAGAHTIDTDTQLDSTGVTNLGFVAGIELPAGGTNGQVLTMMSGMPTWVNSPCVVKVGDVYAGGIVFHVDASGCHGLVVNVSSLFPDSADWGCPQTPIAGADGIAIGTGNQNTIDIEAGCTTVGTAADFCANLTQDGYSDWFLPSRDELVLMYNSLHLQGLGGFVNWYYWSSTEGLNNDAAFVDFDNNGIYIYGSKNFANIYVRAVRAF